MPKKKKEEDNNIGFYTKMTPKMVEMIDEYQEQFGYSTRTQTLFAMIADAHRNMNIAPAVGAVTTVQKKLSRKVYDKERYEEKKLTQEEEKLEEKRNICMGLLGGKIGQDEKGNEVCEFYTYDNKQRFLQEVPLKMVDESLAENQYVPSRQKVLQLQKEGKTNY